MLANEDGNLIATAVCRQYNKFFSKKEKKKKKVNKKKINLKRMYWNIRNILFKFNIYSEGFCLNLCA